MQLKNKYRNSLEILLESILMMGEKTKHIIESTIEALKTIDIEVAKKNLIYEQEINKIEHDLENECMKILSLYHPVASDFRLVTGYLKFITDMERIADQCHDICEIISMNHIEKDENSTLDSIILMFNMSLQMFERVLKIIEKPNEDEANAICKFDDDIDSMFSKIVNDICFVISEISQVQCNIEQIKPKVLYKKFAAADLLFITKYIERIGDHCTNISEWIIYVITGKHLDLN